MKRRLLDPGTGWSDTFVLILIILVATWLRLNDLAQLPPGLHFDLAFNALDIARLQLGDYRIFFPANTGREPLFIYLQALGAYALGLTPFTLRLTSAIVGVVTIPLMYAFTRQLTGSRAIAGLTTIFSAISFWHVFYSRLGLRVILVVPLCIATFWMLWLAMKRLKTKYYIFAGVFLALALYTYLAARLLPFAVIALAICAAWTDSANAWRYLRGLVITLLVAFLLTVPLWYYFWLHPEEFISHSAQISIFTPDGTTGDAVRAFFQNIWLVLNMFLGAGDEGLIRNLPGRPVFDPFLGFLFLAGTGVWLYTLFAPRVSRKARMVALLMAIWLAVSLGASLFSTDAPSFIRTLPALPVVMILPAWGAVAIWDRLNSRLRPFAAIVLVLLVALSAWRTYADYFIAFAHHPALYYAFDQDKVEISDWINRNAANGTVYLAPLFYQQGTIGYLTRQTIYKSFDSRDALVVPSREAGHTVYYAFPTEQSQRIETLARRLPVGKRADVIGSNGAPILLVYQVAADKLPGTKKPLKAQVVGSDFTPTQDSNASWENLIRLVGTRIEPEGEGHRRLDVLLYLQSIRATTRDLTFSIKVRGSDDRVWGQQDKMPGSNSFPTSAWSEGELIVERFYPEFDDCVPAGEYKITLEIYEPGTGSVLALDKLPGNIFELGTLRAMSNCAWVEPNGN